MGKWIAFWLVGLIWGSSFLLIRVGVESLSPWQVVFMRTGIAAVGLTLVVLISGRRLPSDLKRWIPLAILGLGNTTVPFILITWGEQSVDSGLASVLNATAALFTLIIAHFNFTDERITAQKVVGLLVGFIGVIVLASRNLVGGQILTSGLLGQAAVVLAALCYAMFGVYSRKVIKNEVEPVVVAAGSMVTATIASGIGILFTLFTGGHAATPLPQVSSDVLWAIVVLGILNTFIVYIMFYWIIQQLGAARASMVTYIVPVVGLTLGALVLNEAVDSRLILGAGMIFAGIAVVNIRWSRHRKIATVAA